MVIDHCHVIRLVVPVCFRAMVIHHCQLILLLTFLLKRSCSLLGTSLLTYIVPCFKLIHNDFALFSKLLLALVCDLRNQFSLILLYISEQLNKFVLVMVRLVSVLLLSTGD